MHVIDENEMSCNRKESADEQIVNKRWSLPDNIQHYQINITYSDHLMKKDIQKVPSEQTDVKLGNLSPEQQDLLIKKEIGKRIKKNELSKIRGMSISEVNQVIDKDVEPPMDQSRLNRIRLLNMKMGITDDVLDSSIKTPGEKHLQMIEKSQILRKTKLAEWKRDPVMSQIKRGKLGVDNFFILFGIFGSLLIPVYIFNKFKKNREAIINSRIASPQVIKRLDEDSPISLQDVNYHTVHYYNPDRIKEEDVKRRLREQRDKLQRQLYF